jgi:hypothetical protein
MTMGLRPPGPIFPSSPVQARTGPIGKRGGQVNVIDFGLAKKYSYPKTHLHIPYCENKDLTGTLATPPSTLTWEWRRPGVMI